MKKIVFALIAGLFLFSPVFAQEAGPKVLLIIRDRASDRLGFGLAVWHAVQLKRSGTDVRVVFEGEAVVNLLGVAATDKFIDSLNPLIVTPVVSSGTVIPAVQESVSGLPALAQANPTGQSGTMAQRRSEDNSKADFEQLALLLAELKKDIPYTVCALSASLLGLNADMRAAGVAVSPDATRPVDILQYIKDGYRILVL